MPSEYTTASFALLSSIAEIFLYHNYNRYILKTLRREMASILTLRHIHSLVLRIKTSRYF
jgi:hypothetical protein